MRRPDQDDTLDAFCAVIQGGERCRGYLAGIAVARMGSDNRLRAAARGRSGSRGQKLADFGAKAIALRPELRRELLAEVLRIEDGADFDYRFNLGYGRQHTANDPLIAQVREILDRETEARAREAESRDKQS